jgi:hypothetical protein
MEEAPEPWLGSCARSVGYPKPFHDSKKSVGIYLDDPLSAYCPSVQSLRALFARAVAIHSIRKYSFYHRQIGSYALGFTIPSSTVDRAYIIDAT